MGRRGQCREITWRSIFIVPVSFFALVFLVGVGIAEIGDYFRFKFFHDARIGITFMIIPLQVQHAMHHQMRVVRRHWLSLGTGFARDYWRTQRKIALERRAVPEYEGQHIGSIILAAVSAVERPALCLADEAYRDAGVIIKRGLCPFAQLGA